MNKIKLITASCWSATITIIYVFVITVATEYSPALKNWLKNFSGHHWTSKSIFTAVVFLAMLGLFYFGVADGKDDQPKKSLYFLITTAVVLSSTLVLFFIWHDLY